MDMDEDLIKFLVGLIFIILAINTTMILDIASRSPYQNSAAGQGVGEPGTSLILKTPTATTTTTPVTPLQIRTPTPATTTIPPTPPLKQADNLISPYVTIETPVPQVTEPRQLLQPDVSRRSYDNFITIYSLTNQNLTQAFPNVSFNLVNPPLIIDYTITPFNVTDIKYIEYKMKSTYYKENITVNRPFEDTWFTIIIRDKDTGNIIAEDGYGKTRSTDRSNHLEILKSGNFQFTFDGEFGKVNLTMKVDKLGNIP
jgi:hypothetical protein